MTMSTKISIQQVGKVFGEGRQRVEALKDVSLDIADNEFVTFVGASGCGKSTLLRIIGGLEYHTSGEVLASGRPVAAPGADRAMVFQHYSLYPWLKVMENIKFSRRLKHGRENLTSAEVEVASGRADALLSLMGLNAATNAWPNELSGGMQQRVAIARALMQDPKIILADEPIASLDPMNAQVVMDTLRRINLEDGRMVIANLHTLDTARRYCDRVIGMRDGRIVFDGTPDQLSTGVAREIYGADDTFNEAATSTSIPTDTTADRSYADLMLS